MLRKARGRLLQSVDVVVELVAAVRLAAVAVRSADVVVMLRCIARIKHI